MLSRSIVDYLEGLTVSQGRLAGEPFRVLPWEGRFIPGGVPDGRDDGGAIGR